MFHVSKSMTIGILAGAVLLTGTGHAQTHTTTSSSTTTSTSTTTTTLLPHPFSPETRACIRAAQQEFRQCTDTKAACTAAFQAAVAKCFAGTAGQKCATKCEQSESKCLAAVPTTKMNCLKTCRKNRKNDTRACRRIPDGDNIWAGADQGCLVTKDTNFGVCKFQCSEAKMVCHTNFKFCIADCPNL
jgi:hypothetical protein